jgi:hypothetical protein
LTSKINRVEKGYIDTKIGTVFHREDWMLRGNYVGYRGLQRDVVYLGGPIATSYMSPNAGVGGGVSGSQPMSTAVDMEPK